jgi:hypothetical protein
MWDFGTMPYFILFLKRQNATLVPTIPKLNLVLCLNSILLKTILFNLKDKNHHDTLKPWPLPHGFIYHMLVPN